MAPEIFESKPYTIKADVFSFGVLDIQIFRLYFGKCAQERPPTSLSKLLMPS